MMYQDERMRMLAREQARTAAASGGTEAQLLQVRPEMLPPLMPAVLAPARQLVVHGMQLWGGMYARIGWQGAPHRAVQCLHACIVQFVLDATQNAPTFTALSPLQRSLPACRCTSACTSCNQRLRSSRSRLAHTTTSPATPQMQAACSVQSAGRRCCSGLVPSPPACSALSSLAQVPRVASRVQRLIEGTHQVPRRRHQAC